MSSKLIEVNSPVETAALGAYLSELIARPAVVCLRGDLGAGKTHLVQGFARGLGIDQAVTSPSFSLLNRYSRPGLAFELLHFDLYRLENPYLEWEMLGFAELVEGGDICFIEWPDRVAELLPPTAYQVSILYPRDLARIGSDEQRFIQLDERLDLSQFEPSKLIQKYFGEETGQCCN